MENMPAGETQAPEIRYAEHCLALYVLLDNTCYSSTHPCIIHRKDLSTEREEEYK